MTVKERYQANYDIYKNHIDDKATKYEWAADCIFDLVTYDGGLDEMFVKNIIEVCKVILERKNFEYIEDPDNYVKLMAVCQMLNRFNWIEWGTSIRGAYFYVHHHPEYGSKDILEDLEWSEWDFEQKKHIPQKIEKVPFTVENLKALIEFMSEETEGMED